MKTKKYALAMALGLLALAAPRAARADEIYQFDIHADGAISAFSFSFTVPTFVANGGTPAFTPFTITDGTTMWTFAQLLATNVLPPGVGCFEVATSVSLLDTSGACNPLVPSASGSGSLALRIYQSPYQLPTAPGSYALQGVGLLCCPGGNVSGYQPFGSLTITSTPTPIPEPSSLLLLGTGLLGLVGAMRRKWLA